MENAVAEAGRTVCIVRMFNAPRALVFRAWTDPDSLPRWFAPHGCGVRFERLDVRKGGGFHSCITTPDGHECWCVGEYRDVVAPERIVHTMAVANRQGKRIAPAEAGMDPEWPAETVVTITFAEEGGLTRLTLEQTVLESLAKRTGAYPSWLQMLDRLDAEILAGPVRA